MIKEAAPELSVSSSEAEEEKEEHPKLDGEKDPDFSQVTTQAPHVCKRKVSVITSVAGRLGSTMSDVFKAVSRESAQGYIRFSALTQLRNMNEPRQKYLIIVQVW